MGRLPRRRWVDRYAGQALIANGAIGSLYAVGVIGRAVKAVG